MVVAEESRVLGIIPARGGSKGIPGKNLADLGGKPLLAWTIEAGRASKTIDRLILSSDSEEIMEVARQLGCDVPFVRPAELAGDHTPAADPVIHALHSLDQAYDYVVLLQPTSPFRSADDIDACVNACVSDSVPACVSVVETRAHPYWTYLLDSRFLMHPFVERDLVTRRQDLPPAYALNGAVYAARVDWFLHSRAFVSEDTRAYVMPEERSVDVDTPFDLRVARALVQTGDSVA